MNEIGKSSPVTIGKAVELLQAEFPDVTVSSLRFLQREGLISPQERPGKHRQFSPEEIERIRMIKQWQAKRVSLKEIRSLLETLNTSRSLRDVVTDVTNHLLAGDIDTALEELEGVHRSGTPLITLCEEVLTPVLGNLGDENGNHRIPVDMQFELDERLIRFIALTTVRPIEPAAKPVVLAACPSWERHDMPLRIQSALLVERGASVHFVGSMVEGRFLLNAMERLSPDVILISMTISPHPKQVTEWLQPVISNMDSGQFLIVGGLGAEASAHLESNRVVIVGTEGNAVAIERVMQLGRQGDASGATD